MSLVTLARSTSPALVVAFAASLVGALLATPALAAGQTAPATSGQKARVAQGGRVELAASAFRAGDLAALRPDFARLKPRVRGNAE